MPRTLGADGHSCYAKAYRRLSEKGGSCVSYAPIYGSLPGGQALDVAIAAVAARDGRGPDRICSVKFDAEGNCGVIACRFGAE